MTNNTDDQITRQWSESETTPDHPTELSSWEDYKNAPDGTIVAQDGGKPFMVISGLWRSVDDWKGDHNDMWGTRRRVLRWGWDA